MTEPEATGFGADLVRAVAEQKDAPVTRVVVLSEELAAFLGELRHEEIEGIRKLARLGPDGIQKVLAAVDFWQSISTVGKFVKWAIILFSGAIVGVAAVVKAIQEIGLMLGGKPP